MWLATLFRLGPHFVNDKSLRATLYIVLPSNIKPRNIFIFHVFFLSLSPTPLCSSSIMFFFHLLSPSLFSIYISSSLSWRRKLSPYFRAENLIFSRSNNSSSSSFNACCCCCCCSFVSILYHFKHQTCFFLSLFRSKEGDSTDWKAPCYVLRLCSYSKG